MNTEITETLNETTYSLSNYITISAINCNVRVEGYDPNYGPTNKTKVIVSGIQPSGISMLFFKSVKSYPLAEQNWFHFRDGQKNKYFDNKVRLNPTGSKGINQSFIQFTEEPNLENSKTISGNISTTFDIVNENGLLNDPTLIIEL
jgi:hypothetical protein